MAKKLDRFLFSIGEDCAYWKCMPLGGYEERWRITVLFILIHVIQCEKNLYIDAEYEYDIKTTDDTIDEDIAKYEDIVAEEIYNAIVKDGKLNVDICKKGLKLTNINKGQQ
jgi:hypothetical protein